MARCVLRIVLLIYFVFLYFAFGNEECDLYFKNLTNALAATYLCFGEFGQPVSICSRCICNIATLELILSDSVSKNQFGVPCRSSIEREALLEPWARTISPIRKIWLNAHCDQCLIGSNFASSHPLLPAYGTDNNLPSYNLSAYNNATRNFFDQLATLSECISAHVLNSNASFLDQVNFPTESSIQLNKNVCLDCHWKYARLYEVYESWVRETTDQEHDKWYHPQGTSSFNYRRLCIDVVDALNRTQFVWLGILDCSTRSVTRPVVALLPLIICTILGVVFHAAMLCVFHQPSRVIVYMQSRVEAVTDSVERTPITDEPNSRETHHSTLFRKTSFAPVTRIFPFDPPNAGDPNTGDS
ncbi:osteopetrosis associated transmembrane protein [Echinococcus multilocularis]|uniref:Osteopetrosis associated transmembrane protein n=1 Tax=Echinococcus multilocularis TaxID=6211 RepID=A0A068Y8E9_ECHMU|nr:osteopetrosis associated transmembrane protein [Echinococcus multilocularis]